MFEQILSKQEELNAQIKKLQEEAAQQVKPLLQAFMKEHPTVKQIAWSQYTPYFNDGDTCTFGLRGVGFYFEGEDLEERADEMEIWGEWDSEYFLERKALTTKETWEACKALAAGLNDIDGALLSLFGDHVQVIVTPNGVEVDEYDHD